MNASSLTLPQCGTESSTMCDAVPAKKAVIAPVGVGLKANDIAAPVITCVVASIVYIVASSFNTARYLHAPLVSVQLLSWNNNALVS